MVTIFADKDKMKMQEFFPQNKSRNGAKRNDGFNRAIPSLRVAPFRLLFVVVLLLFCNTVSALEYIRFTHNGRERNEEGKILAEDRRGIDFLARDGQAYYIAHSNIIARRSDDTPFVPYTRAQMLERLRMEFPPNQGFSLGTYGSFIIVYTTSRDFADWYGRLLQRLHQQYVAHWRRLGVELSEPEFQMVAIVLPNEAVFRQFAEREGTILSRGQIAYYHKLTNRIVLFDMSGVQTFQAGTPRRATTIRMFLSQPEAYDNIRTVIHEAVHQVGFNTGMHPRFVTSPMWVLEGLAIFHETPDQRDWQVGWTLGPHVNPSRLARLRQYLFSRPHADSPIIRMIRDDDLFRAQATALDNYALAWGLFSFLHQTRPRELAAYLKILQGKTFDSEDTCRIRDFESVFGDDWERFDEHFLDFVRR